MNAKVPNAVLYASRSEHTNVPLEVISGTVPAELQGHLFLVSPVGTVASGGRPVQPPASVMNGDGMVLRVDFAAGVAKFTTRLMKTWDQRADELTNASSSMSSLRFHPAGIARLGWLGARNFANTAFQAFGAAGEPTRMLVTYDAGRPWEIDPLTLEAITPIGKRTEWIASALPNRPFPLFLTPAHPAYDPKTGELVTVNYVRSNASLVGIPGAAELVTRLPDGVQRGVRSLLRRTTPVVTASAAVRKALPLGQSAMHQFVEGLFLPPNEEHSCRVLQWNGEGSFTATSLVLASAEPVVIEQSIHQIALTQSHVVLLDTGFKIGMAQLFNEPFANSERVDAALRKLVDKPQMDKTILYIVRRDALGKGVPAVAQKVVIPIEADHFLADYDDRSGTITVHVGHAPATDLADWGRSYDKRFYTKKPMAENAGFLSVGAMDVGRLGRYEIEASTGKVTDAKVISDDEKLWAISVYAGRHIGTTDPLPERITSIFWGTEGFVPDLLTEWVFNNYKDYAHRETPLSQIRSMGTTGRPACIVRLDTKTMTLADSRLLPAGCLMSSIQVPVRRAPFLTRSFAPPYSSRHETHRT